MSVHSKHTLRKETKNNFITYGMLLLAFIVMQSLSSAGALKSQTKGLLVPICIYVIMAVSLNLTVGVLGELSLGHAGFMCVGAYSSSLFSILTQQIFPSAWVRFPLAILVGGITAALFGLLVGIPVLRLEGDYLAIVTLAFGEIIKNFVSNLYIVKDINGLHVSMKPLDLSKLDMASAVSILKGPAGIDGTPRDASFAVAFVLVLICVLVITLFIDSKAGRAVMAIRDNKIAAESLGINTAKYKLITITMSAFFAGIAGVLYAHNYATLAATTKNFGYNMSIMILVYVVLGGMGSIRGSIIAAVALTVLPEWLRFLQDYRMLIYAVVLIAVMLLNASPAVTGWVNRVKAACRNRLAKCFSRRQKNREGA